MTLLRRWLREPLLHFIIGGALLFFFYDAVASPKQSDDRILVDAQLVAGLRADHQRRTGKPPTAEEERALVDRYVEQELLYREALALGLDQGDIIVRRRLVQKMEMILENATSAHAASDAELQAFLDSHAARYAQPERLSLTHVFVSTQRWGAQARAQADLLRQSLLAGVEASVLGDPFVHGGRLNARSQVEIAAMFGPDFANAIARLQPGQWSEPLHSAYGVHLVRIEARMPSSVPRLDDVRSRLREDWLQAHREKSRAEGLRRLRARYQVVPAE